MEQVLNTFIGGIDTDTSRVKYPPDKYWKLENGRLIVDEILSSGAITNMKGNIELPINTDTFFGTAILNYKLVGWTLLNNDYILFYSEINSYRGRIYRVHQVDDDNFEFARGNGTHPYYGVGGDPTLTYVYQDDNLAFGDTIYAIGRYESVDVQKIYWVDLLASEHNNQFRMLNLADPNLVSVSSEYINITNPVSWGSFNFLGYTSGNLQSGSIQYAYRYYNKYGVETLFSPASNLYDLSNFLNKSDIWNTFGLSANSETTLGISMELYGLDPNYYGIEIISLHYNSSTATPDIKIIKRQPLSTTTSIIFTDTGSITIGTLTYDEINQISTLLYAKTLAVKDNRMFLGNITEEIYWNSSLDDWDSRAYRFRSKTYPIVAQQRVATLYADFINYNSEYNIDGVVKNWPNMITQKTLNCLNISNDLTRDFDTQDIHIGPAISDVRQNYYGFEYQSDGTTPGGEGMNIKYEFTYDSTQFIDKTTSKSQIASSYTDSKKTILNLTSFLRDEIYRFGIVFYDQYGRPSPAKWIADIRMPLNVGSATFVTNIGGDQIAANQLNLKFTLINGLPSSAAMWQIVYVKREEKDATILDQGVIYTTNNHYLTETQNTVRPATRVFGLYKNVVDDHNISFDTVRSKKYLQFFSPGCSIGKQIPDGAYIEFAGFMELGDGATNSPYTETTIPGTANKYYYKYTNFSKYFYRIKLDIEDKQLVIPGQINGKFEGIDDNFDSIHPNFLDNSGTSGTFIGITIDDDTILTNYLIDASAVDARDYSNCYNGTCLTNIKKPNAGAYGGNTYYDRLRNVYIAASDPTPSPDVWCTKGDTYIGYFDVIKCMAGDFLGRVSTVTYLNIMENLAFPVESRYNLNLRSDRSPFKENSDVLGLMKEIAGTWTFWYSDIFKQDYNLYDYNSAYSKLDEARLFLSETLDIRETIEQPVQVKYSNYKYDNEEIDSWLKFLPNNFNTATGTHGEISYLVELNNQIFCLQEHGTSAVASNRQELTNGSSGIAVVLGKGGVLDRFDYLSTEIGCQLNCVPVQSPNSFYWIDVSRKKLYRVSSAGIENMSDVKFVSALIKNSIDANSSIYGIYDHQLNSTFFTIRNTDPNYIGHSTLLSATYNYESGIFPAYRISFTGTTDTFVQSFKFTTIREKDIYSFNGHNYKIIDVSEYHIDVLDETSTYPLVGDIDLSEYMLFKNEYTISYNELLGVFEAFHTILPDMWLANADSIVTYADDDSDPVESRLWLQNLGEYGKYCQIDVYGKTYVYKPLLLDMIISAGTTATKEFNNISLFTEITNDYQDDPDRIYDTMQVENSYQQSDVIPLVPYRNPDDIAYTDSITIPARSTWNSGSTYSLNGVVHYITPVTLEENDWISLTNNNLNNAPYNSPLYWKKYNLFNIRRNLREWDCGIPRADDWYDTVPYYDATTLYVPGSIVRYNNKRYILRPTITTYSSADKYALGSYVYYGSTVYKMLATGIGAWRLKNGGSSYSIGNIITVAGGTLGRFTVTGTGILGVITGLTQLDKGYGYSVSATSNTTVNTGSGNSATIEIQSIIAANRGIPPSTPNWSAVVRTPSGTSDNTELWEFYPVYNRMRDTFLKVKLVFENDGQSKLVSHDVTTSYEKL